MVLWYHIKCINYQASENTLYSLSPYVKRYKIVCIFVEQLFVVSCMLLSGKKEFIFLKLNFTYW